MNNYLRKMQIIEVLRTLGLLSNEQETDLKNNATECYYNTTIQKTQGAQPSQNVDFSAFYKSPSRKNLRDFFNNNFNVGEKFDEKTFVNLVENLEKEAISGYEKNKDFTQNLARSNDSAKGKLISQAQNANEQSVKADKIFTRKEIDAMSLEEFQKNESTIMSQYEQGLIQ